MYIIKEEQLSNGTSKFTPQGYFEGQWKTLSHKAFGFNDNGLNYCETLEEANLLIDRFKKTLAHHNSNVTKEIIHILTYSHG